jgi:hypothetical protein
MNRPDCLAIAPAAFELCIASRHTVQLFKSIADRQAVTVSQQTEETCELHREGMSCGRVSVIVFVCVCVSRFVFVFLCVSVLCVGVFKGKSTHPFECV